MSSEWTPPADGAPCWINIFATDVIRGEHFITSLLASTNPDQHSARKFWSEALGWKFRESTTHMDGTEENPEEIAHFEHGANCPGRRDHEGRRGREDGGQGRDRAVSIF